MQVTFVSNFFSPISGDSEDDTPSGGSANALANWLEFALRERGLPVEGVIPEDFGWVVMVSRKPFLLWLGCGNTEGSTDEWTVFVVAELSPIHRLFKRHDSGPAVERLRDHLVELVPSIPGVTHIVWD